MELNGTAVKNGKTNGEASHNGHNGNGTGSNGKDIFQNSYPVFTLQSELTNEQKEFFEKNGFIHFKRFISKDIVNQLLSEAEKIQNDWVNKDLKMINGVPIKY